ncbi:MAG: hypothetical protein WCA77_04230, partial [Thermoplasmata archaeon]
GMIERSPDHQVTEDELVRLIAFTTAPADEAVQNIINWGRFTGLLRYDSESHLVTGVRSPRSSQTAPTAPRYPPPGGPVSTVPSSKRSGTAHREPPPEQSVVPLVGQS